MSASKDVHITKSKSPNYVIELMPTDALIAHAIALQKERAELERKLAEQQAALRNIYDDSKNDSNAYIHLTAKHGLEYGTEELNTLLTRAKEETANECALHTVELTKAFQDVLEMEIAKAKERGRIIGLAQSCPACHSKGYEEGRKEAVPEGWQVVPNEPTFEMISAMNQSGWIEGNYKAVLSAAPKPQGETK